MKRQIIISLIFCAIMIAACGGSSDENAGNGSRLDPDSPAGQGQRVFKMQCAACHAVSSDRQVVGPSLQGITNRAGDRVEGLSVEEYLRESILNPNAYIVEGFSEGQMPQNFGRMLSSEDLDNLIAYLLTLDGGNS